MRVDPQEGAQEAPASLEEIAGDRSHGAAWLSLRALQLLGQRAARLGWSEADAIQGWAELADLARAIIASRPAMAVLRNRVNRLVHSSRGLPAFEVAELADRLIAEAVEAERGAAAFAAGYLAGRRVATLSRSNTVLAALLIAQPPPAAVLVLESRPGAEGRALARDLAGSRLPVTLLPDAAAAAALASLGVDVVVVGADAVLPDGSVINKTGTRPLALAAREQGIPCYAAAACDKLGAAAAGDEQGELDESCDSSAAVAVWAPLFEVTPAGLFAGVLTERGALTPAVIANVAAELAGLGSWAAR